MANIADNKAALAYLLEQVFLADVYRPIPLALKQAGVQSASDLLLMSLEVSQDRPLKYDLPAEGSVTPCGNVPNHRTQGLHS